MWGGERIAPQSEVIRAMSLEDSPCAARGPYLEGVGGGVLVLVRVPGLDRNLRTRNQIDDVRQGG